MEFKIIHKYFNKAISDISKVVSDRTPFPILSGIKITVDADGLTFVGSNTDMIIEQKLPLEIDGLPVLKIIQTGSVVLPAKYISEIIKRIPNGIHFIKDEYNKVTIQSKEIVLKLNGFHPDEYPKTPEFNSGQSFAVQSGELKEIISQTYFATSKNETKPVLTGVNMILQGNRFICTATNSHRLAIKEISIATNLNGSFTVPIASLKELTRLIVIDDSIVNIFCTDNYIIFQSSLITLYSRLIEGNYPNVQSLIPQYSKTTIKLNRNKFLKGIDRACLFASEWKNNNIHLEIQDGPRIKISSNSTDVGKIEETQPLIELKGEKELRIFLDGSFLVDALKAIKEDEIIIRFTGSMKPVLIQPVNDSSHSHLISPVRSY